MKAKYLLISAAALSLGVGFTACNDEEDDIFGESSAKRIDATLKDYNAVLTAPANGWLMQYFPGGAQDFGGFNICLKFDQDGSVTATADYSEGKSAKSLYQLKQSNGACLAFDLYNGVIHYLSDPKSYEGSGTGYGFEGDYDFTILSCSADSVVLLGSKTGSRAKLTQLTVSAEDYLAQIENVKNSLTPGDAVDATFNGKEAEVDVSYNNYYLTYTDSNGSEQSVSIPLVYTTEGLRTYQPVMVDGTPVEKFKVVDGNIVSEDGRLVFIPYPAPVSHLLGETEWYISYANTQLSKATTNYWETGYQDYAAMGLRMKHISMYGYGPYLVMSCYIEDPSAEGGITEGALAFTCTKSGGRNITLQLAGFFDATANALYNKYGFDLIAQRTFNGSFYVECDDPFNPTAILLYNTTTGDQFLLSSEPQDYPFAPLEEKFKPEEQPNEPGEPGDEGEETLAMKFLGNKWLASFDGTNALVQKYWAAGYQLFAQTGYRMVSISLYTVTDEESGAPLLAVEFFMEKPEDRSDTFRGTIYMSIQLSDSQPTMAAFKVADVDSEETYELYQKGGLQYFVYPLNGTFAIQLDDEANPTSAMLQSAAEDGAAFLLTNAEQTYPFQALENPTDEEETANKAAITLPAESVKVMRH